MEVLKTRGYAEELPCFDALTVTVPGAAAAWCDVVSKFGTMPLSEVSLWIFMSRFHSIIVSMEVI
jgi:gamma-glutamyltranspeptidase